MILECKSWFRSRSSCSPFFRSLPWSNDHGAYTSSFARCNPV